MGDQYIERIKKFVDEMRQQYTTDFTYFEKIAAENNTSADDVTQRINYMAKCALACEMKIADLESILSARKELINRAAKERPLTKNEEYLLGLDIVFPAYMIIQDLPFDEIINYIEQNQ